MSLAAKLAQGVGTILHGVDDLIFLQLGLRAFGYCVHLTLASQYTDRDSSRWNMDSKTIQRRRLLFYEIFSSDVLNVRYLWFLLPR